MTGPEHRPRDDEHLKISSRRADPHRMGPAEEMLQSMGAALFGEASIDAAEAERLVRWYERLLDELPISVFIKDLEGRYVVVNRRFVEVYAATQPVTREDLIGRSDHDFLPGPDAEVYDYKDGRVIAGEEIHALEEQLVRADGTVMYFSTTKYALRDEAGRPYGLVGVSAEISEPVRVADALAESERRYRLALRASRDGIWEMDLATQTIVLSARCSRLLHLPVSNDPMPALGIFSYDDPDERTRLIDAILELRDHPTRMMSLRSNVVLVDGARRTLQIDGAPLTEHGRTIRIIGSIADVTDAVINEERLQHLANHDDLTSLDNRRSLLAKIDDVITTGAHDCVLLFLDLDDFKLVNDSLGHLAGDRMLMSVAERISSTVSDGDVVARLGGDEFAVLLQSNGDRDRAARVSQAIIDSFAKPFLLGDVETYASASIGVLALDGYHSSDDLLRDADTAMYSAKRERSSVRYFEPDMHRVASSLRQLHSDLRRASDANEFHLAFQPLVDADDHSVVSLEALLRWTPEGSTTSMSPAMFLPALEQTGLIVDVGRWVIGEACRQLAVWRDVHGLRDISVSINLSRAQLHHRSTVDDVAASLRRFGLSGSDITFEITETAISTDTDQLLCVLQDLRALGTRMAIDDFGVGQSCLAQLHEIPIDFIKIDMSFVSRIRSGAVHDDPVLRAILTLGRELEKRTVAEGVETAGQATWLAAHGCDQLQGYFFDRPLSPVQVAEQIRDGRLVTSGGIVDTSQLTRRA